MSDTPLAFAHPLVEFKDVTFSYPASVGERVILGKVSFSVPRGKVTALMGASGGGKTTVLRLIGGQQKAGSGEVLFDGKNVAQMTQPALYAARRRMGMLFQFGALFTDLSVFDNVAFPLREHTGLDDSLIRDIVLMKLNAVGLRGARDLMPSEVSGGMARRVALARAIVLDPELIMYDEPFAGLDPISLALPRNSFASLTTRWASPASWSRMTWKRPFASPTRSSSWPTAALRHRARPTRSGIPPIRWCTSSSMRWPKGR